MTLLLLFSYFYHKITTQYWILRHRPFRRYVFCQVYKVLIVKERNMTLDPAHLGEETAKNILKYHFHGKAMSVFKMVFKGWIRDYLSM